MGKGLRRKRGEINDLNKELGGGGGEDLREERQKLRQKGLTGERGEMISTGKGVEKILGRKGRRSGEKRPTGKGGKRS